MMGGGGVRLLLTSSVICVRPNNGSACLNSFLLTIPSPFSSNPLNKSMILARFATSASRNWSIRDGGPEGAPSSDGAPPVPKRSETRFAFTFIALPDVLCFSALSAEPPERRGVTRKDGRLRVDPAGEAKCEGSEEEMAPTAAP